jgi:hypothetical protein
VGAQARRRARHANGGRSGLRQSLVWFFDQWVRGTGLLDYAYGGASGDAEWTLQTTVSSAEGLKHAMPVGV